MCVRNNWFLDMTERITNFINSNDFKKLNKINNYKAGLHIFARNLITVACFYIVFFYIHSNLLISIIFFYFYCINISFFGYAGIGHELSHKRVFSSKRINVFFYRIYSSLTWNNDVFFEKNHYFHHKNTFNPKDLEAKSEENWSISAITFYLLIDFRLMHKKISYAIFNSLGKYPSGECIKCIPAINSARRILIVNIIIMTIIMWATNSIALSLLYLIAPFTGTLCNKILAKSQHHGLENKKDDGPLQFSRTMKLPYVLSFLYANMNYHAEHHLAPSIPFYNLPEFHKILLRNGYIESTTLRDFLRNFKK